MTELELRMMYVNAATGYYGCKENDGSHKPIIDLYNSYTPHPRGYRMTYDAPWCAAFASAMAVECGFTDIIPVECSCSKQIELFKQKGIFDPATAKSFKENVLEVGGSVDPMETYIKFRGHAPSVDALLRNRGLAPQEKPVAIPSMKKN